MLSYSQLAAAIFITLTFNIMHSSDAFIKTLEVLTEYNDVFLGSLGGKPQLGTTSATCWARGGTCLHIRFCYTYDMEAGVPGCTTRYKVCCKNFKHQPPTIGVQRSQDEYAENENEDSRK